ncbi:MAG TPA: glycosyltransferase family 2 protein, partial [Ignavibacteriaceae bacterium]|nr:glycosyltransferase family 2 protein [Ignavibacteriaceae bacterium]
MSNPLKKNNVCAIIPFFNEENTIKEVIEKTFNYVDLIICIDDGSTDSSLNKIPANDNLIVLKNKANIGKGYSLRKGFEKSIELKTKYTITLDADLQHPPEKIPSFIEQLKNNDVVVGNRLNNLSDMPLQRIMSNKLTSKCLSLKTKTKIIDSQCGYRGFRTEIIKLILPDYNGYEAESEMLVKAARKNLKISFIDIPT